MRAALPTDLLLRLANATPEQYAAVEKVLSAVQLEMPAPVDTNVAQAAFALLVKLDAQEIYKKPSPLTVFRLYCIEGMSAEQIATKCRCAKGTVISRLRFIEQATNTKDVFDDIVRAKTGSTRFRWERAAKDKAFASILNHVVVETTADEFLAVLKAGTVSTNVFLRRLHNFAFGMNWLLTPLIPKNAWPKVEFKEKRAITADEHRRIIERERNPERKAFYEMCWHVGGSQTDMATAGKIVVLKSETETPSHFSN